MEASSCEPCAGTCDSTDKTADSEEGCVSLARSDSGQGKSISSVDFPEENISPNEVTNLDVMKEIDDETENYIFEEKTKLKTNNENACSSTDRTGVYTNQDSGIEKSPVSQQFQFSGSSIHPLPELNSENMVSRKQQKDMFEGPVSNLSDVDRGKSDKSSLKRQVSFDFPPGDFPPFDFLDLNSFAKDKPIWELDSNTRNRSPEVSLASSSDSHGKYHHLVNSSLPQGLVNTASGCNVSPCDHVFNKTQVQTHVNGYSNNDNTTSTYPVGIQNGHGKLAFPEAANSVCHTPPQGMVPQRILDAVVKELTLAKKKISALESDNTILYQNYDAVVKENMILCQNWTLQVEKYESRLSGLHHDVDDWKSKYVEIKEQLETKERELQAKQQEICLQRNDLACLEAMRHDLEVKDGELQTLREQCQVLRFQKEGLESMASKSVIDDLQQHMQNAVRFRQVLNRSDETQVKTL